MSEGKCVHVSGGAFLIMSSSSSTTFANICVASGKNSATVEDVALVYERDLLSVRGQIDLETLPKPSQDGAWR